MWLLWLIVAIAFALAEIATAGFFLIWFAVGALVALISSFFTSSLIVQTTIFIVISLLLTLTLTKFFSQKYAKKDTTPTNIDALIGHTGIVTQAIGPTPHQTGLVKLDGEMWTALTLSGEELLEGTTVSVNEIKGVRIIVSKTI